MQQQQGEEFLRLPHKPPASWLLRESTNNLLNHCPLQTHSVKMPCGMRAMKVKRTDLEGGGHNRNVKRRIWPHYWRGHMKARGKSNWLQFTFFYALSGLCQLSPRISTLVLQKQTVVSRDFTVWTDLKQTLQFFLSVATHLSKKYFVKAPSLGRTPSQFWCDCWESFNNKNILII